MNIATIPSFIELTDDGVAISAATLPCIIGEHFGGTDDETNERDFHQYISTDMESVIYHFAYLAMESDDASVYLDEQMDAFGTYLIDTFAEIHDYSDGLWCPENGEHVLFGDAWIVPAFNDGAVFRSQLKNKVEYFIQIDICRQIIEQHENLQQKVRKLKSKNAKANRKK